MKLFINKQIMRDAQKAFLWNFLGEDGITYSDVNAFLEAVPEGEPVDVELYSCGGDCTEGLAIYDALRTCGHSLSTTIVGECASMATIIALCAPKESRRAFKHARLLIHEPYYPTCIDGDVTLSRAEQLRKGLEDEKAKMVSIYVERTGTSEEAILAQIEEGKWFDTDRALELGFISEIVPETSAAVVPQERISTTIENNNEELMKNENKSAIARAFSALGSALGFTESDEQAVGLTLTATDGTELTIERDEGDIQVGDPAAPDGTFTLEDGRTITIQEGVITEIRQPEETEEAPVENDELEELRAENDRLRQQLEELQASVAQLTSMTKSEEESTILAAVAALGGLDSLKAMPVGKVNIPVDETPHVATETNVFDAIMAMKKK